MHLKDVSVASSAELTCCLCDWEKKGFLSPDLGDLDAHVADLIQRGPLGKRDPKGVPNCFFFMIWFVCLITIAVFSFHDQLWLQHSYTGAELL